MIELVPRRSTNERTGADVALVLGDDDVRRQGRQALRVDAVHWAPLRGVLPDGRVNGHAGHRRINGGVRAARQLRNSERPVSATLRFALSLHQ